MHVVVSAGIDEPMELFEENHPIIDELIVFEEDETDPSKYRRTKHYTSPRMTDQEMNNYLDSLLPVGFDYRLKALILKYSLGIPLLGQTLASKSLIISSSDNPLDIILETTTKYLQTRLFLRADIRDNWNRSATRYIGTPLDSILEEYIARNIEHVSNRKTVYDRLPKILIAQKMSDVQADPIARVIPELVCPASLEIIDSYLKFENLTRCPLFMIFVPQIPNEIFNQLFNGGHRKRAINAFDAIMGKMVSYFYEGPVNQTHLFQSERRILEDGNPDIIKFIQSLEDISPLKQNHCSFAYGVSDHEHIVDQVAQNAFAMESLFQQLGIPYFAKNSHFGKQGSTYYYDSQNNSIRLLN